MTAPFDGADYRRATDHFPNFEARPLIGITGNFGDKGCELAEGYYESIVAALPRHEPSRRGLAL